MILTNLLTIARNDYYMIEISKQKNRAYLTLRGHWKNPNDLSNYINDVEAGIQKLSPGFTLLADLTQYSGTSSELYHLHIEAQKLAVGAGLSRAAEVFTSNPLLKILFDSYAKESGANAMAFQDKLHAERWLDLY